MSSSSILLGLALYLYLPLQLGFLLLGIELIRKRNKSKARVAGGILSLLVFLAMLPFTRIAAVLLYLSITGGSFGA